MDRIRFLFLPGVHTGSAPEIGSLNRAAPPETGPARRQPPPRQSKPAKNRLPDDRTQKFSLIALLGCKTSISPGSASEAGLSPSRSHDPARSGLNGMLWRTVGAGSRRAFRVGARARRKGWRTNDYVNRCRPNRATGGGLFRGGRWGLSPGPGEIRPVLHAAGPEWPPIFTRRPDLKFKVFALTFCPEMRLAPIFVTLG